MKEFLNLQLLLIFAIFILSFPSAYGRRRLRHVEKDFDTDIDPLYGYVVDDLYDYGDTTGDVNIDEIDLIIESRPSQDDAWMPMEPGEILDTYPVEARSRSSGRRPRQPTLSPLMTLGANIWNPQSVLSEPPYMNSGGLPTGSNMYTIPYAKRGFIGTLVVMGTSHNIGQKYKYYGIYPSPYEMIKAEGFGEFSGKSVAMYTIFPFTFHRRRSKNITRPSLGFNPMYLPSAFHRRNQGGVYQYRHFSMFSAKYVGKCHIPIQPKNSVMLCRSNQDAEICQFRCGNSYSFPDGSIEKENKCWHAVGVWKPWKNVPRCKSKRNRTISITNTRDCDIRRLSGDVRIRWLCNHSQTEKKCIIKCPETKVFLTTPAEAYYCWPNGTWSPDHIPPCVDPGYTLI